MLPIIVFGLNHFGRNLNKPAPLKILSAIFLFTIEIVGFTRVACNAFLPSNKFITFTPSSVFDNFPSNFAWSSTFKILNNLAASSIFVTANFINPFNPNFVPAFIPNLPATAPIFPTGTNTAKAKTMSA
ncbi:hypothetical protein ES703_119147 [subsurface metagenome]